MRIELRDLDGFKFTEMAEWMTERFGSPQDEVTWFWSTGDVYFEENPLWPGQMLEKVKPMGVKFFQPDKYPHEILLAAMIWGTGKVDQ